MEKILKVATIIGGAFTAIGTVVTAGVGIAEGASLIKKALKERNEAKTEKKD